jgi:hypothetical protein
MGLIADIVVGATGSAANAALNISPGLAVVRASLTQMPAVDRGRPSHHFDFFFLLSHALRVHMQACTRRDIGLPHAAACGTGAQLQYVAMYHPIEPRTRVRSRGVAQCLCCGVFDWCGGATRCHACGARSGSACMALIMGDGRLLITQMIRPFPPQWPAMCTHAASSPRCPR